MPSTSKKQHNFMAAIAHSPEFAKKAGVPTKVGKHFMEADKGKKFGGGGMAKKLFGGKETYSEEKKEAQALKSGKISERGFVRGEKSEGHKEENSASLARKIKSGKMSPASYAKMESGEKEMKTKKMAVGGMPTPNPKEVALAVNAMKKRMAPGMAAPRRPVAAPAMPGAPAPTMKSGGRISSKGEHSVQKQSKRGAEMVKMAKGGFVRSADGIASKGKTRGTHISMSKGGMAKKRYC